MLSFVDTVFDAVSAGLELSISWSWLVTKNESFMTFVNSFLASSWLSTQTLSKTEIAWTEDYGNCLFICHWYCLLQVFDI